MFNELVKEITQILDANEELDQVFSYDVEQFKGDPAATVTPSSNESDYITNQENVRIYAFNVTLFVNRTNRTADKAEEVMRDLVYSVIDDFDRNYTLSGIETPPGYTFINLFATPSSWGYAGRESEYRVSEINLRARVCVDLNQI